MIRILLFTVATLACALLAGCGKYKEETYEIGYKGEARFNPFLAASRLLERFGYEPDRSSGISRLPKSDSSTTIILPAGSVPSFGSAKRIRQWVEDGGHLIYLASGYGQRNSGSIGAVFEILADKDHPLLEEFGIELVGADNPDHLLDLRIHSRPLSIDLPEAEAFAIPPTLGDADVASGETDKSRLISLPLRNGRLTLIGNATPFRNRHIENHDHARVILELMELHNAQNVLFIYGKGTSFMKMLWHYAWMPLLGLAILTLLWIWKNLPRFGPVVPMIDGGTRQFTEHIEMSGRFLWRHKASTALLAPLVSEIDRKFQEKYPHIDDSVEARTDYFVEHTDLPRDQISEALSGLPVRDPATMTRIVKNLKLLIESL